MIRSESLNNGQRVKHYSDNGVMIRQNETGALYDEAIDVMPCQYTYSESDTPLIQLSAEELLDILMGGEDD